MSDEEAKEEPTEVEVRAMRTTCDDDDDDDGWR
jgi:hypothetical protein